ncbi:MAG TPA: RNA 2',3'-cyclic phosphodiesterase [Planctomycetes bacterium]|nr:RNA 2',3'-cyclic phosphodiesterase [Planctomycetota bacterium]
MSRRLRCFVGIPLSSQVRGRLEREIGFLQLAGAPVRWVPKENMHITVRFLGEIDPDEVIPVCRVLEEVADEVPRHRLEIRKLILFPPGKPPRVIASGVEGDTDKLLATFNLLQDRFETIGFRREQRRLMPHVTLGRLKGPPGEDLLNRVERAKARGFGVVDVNALHLILSERSPNGAVYSSMEAVDLLG